MRQSLIPGAAVPITVALTFVLIASQEAQAVSQCRGPVEDTAWGTIERMGSDQLIGTLVLVGLLVTLAIVGVRRLRATTSAVRQSREYESRALTALYFNRVDEAVNAADSFPSSPVAAVVSASLQGPSSYARSGVDPCKPDRSAFNRALIAQTHKFKRGLWVVAAIGWSSPVVGLVTALGPSTINASQPPVPLLLGLAIAIPAIWLYKGLSSEADLLLFETDRMSLSIVDQIADQLEAGFDNEEALGHHKPREIRLPIPSQDSRSLC
jgi:biopolymer transport protein ExbB/TolQ